MRWRRAPARAPADAEAAAAPPLSGVRRRRVVADPALGTALGESLAAEAIAVLQVDGPSSSPLPPSVAHCCCCCSTRRLPTPRTPSLDPDAVDAADAAAVDESAAILEIDPSAVGAAAAPAPSSKGGGGTPGHRTRAQPQPQPQPQPQQAAAGFGGPSARALLADSLIASFAKERSHLQLLRRQATPRARQPRGCCTA